ncbi:hypothetical protein E3N88_25859 [Mikania micrantha]|uniref:Uncharacterized protein n=1 Tax=Mikania micrantha TaxID=192012 RepID=A0A5N6N7I4_9ASTR|nr:hypothetical protein E3N88_25859 [Mikania micrantha]
MGAYQAHRWRVHQKVECAPMKELMSHPSDDIEEEDNVNVEDVESQNVTAWCKFKDLNDDAVGVDNDKEDEHRWKIREQYVDGEGKQMVDDLALKILSFWIISFNQWE